jgi:hypothetical protein
MADPGLVYDYWNLFSANRLTLPAGRHYAGLGTIAGVHTGEAAALREAV